MLMEDSEQILKSLWKGETKKKNPFFLLLWDKENQPWKVYQANMKESLDKLSLFDTHVVISPQ